jgi:hypothetical protein
VQLTGQWADSVQLLEKLYLLQLMLWGGLATTTGTAMLAYARRQEPTASLVSTFGVTLAGVGAVILGLAAWARQAVTLRDHASVITLDRALWAVVGAAATIAIASLARTALSLRLPHRTEDDARSAAAHSAIALHATAVALLSCRLATALVR